MVQKIAPKLSGQNRFYCANRHRLFFSYRLYPIPFFLVAAIPFQALIARILFRRIFPAFSWVNQILKPETLLIKNVLFFEQTSLCRKPRGFRLFSNNWKTRDVYATEATHRISHRLFEYIPAEHSFQLPWIQEPKKSPSWLRFDCPF